ncbi:glutathione synthetase [Saprospiraceae bacterium]|nr:glutathione synthetase [Saprospiraceae bacterium]
MENDLFFSSMDEDCLMGTRVDRDFEYTEGGKYFNHNLKKLNLQDYNMVIMRLPRPLSDYFLIWLDSLFPDTVIINSPSGIMTTGSKQYLINVPELCPEIKLCYSIEEIEKESEKHPIVLKPLKEYGGKGILKIVGNRLSDGMEEFNARTYLQEIKETIEKDGLLSMKYLKNVTQGDKRILVVGGEILAASMRLPAKGSWLCNVAQGGTSEFTEVTRKEREIIKILSPKLEKLGILIYGADTLVDDNGERVLSEINTLSIGGFPQAEAQTGKPIVRSLIDKIIEYADEWTR